MSRLSLLVLAALLCVVSLFGAASAAECLSQVPFLKKGAACGFEAYCGYGLFCSREGVCTESVKVGEPCPIGTECPMFSTCRGPSNAKICVANANLGDQCNNTNSESTLGYCPTECSNDYICRGGNVGDACTATNQCTGNLTCSNGVCTPLNNGQICLDDTDCKPQSYCSGYNRKCTPRKTSGICSFNSECAYGYFCLGFDQFDSRSCHPLGSREVGEYCEDDEHCSGRARCFNNKCAAKRVTHCTNDSQCGNKQYCACGSDYRSTGVGTCRSDPCSSKLKRYEECVATNCQSSWAASSKSCASLNCLDESEAFFKACYYFAF